MESIGLHYRLEADRLGGVSTNVNVDLEDSALFLGDVLEAFAAFLRAAGFTYVTEVGVRTESTVGFTTYAKLDDAYESDQDEWEDGNHDLWSEPGC
jgi:hypothetical protein